jgi:hypothetical protein
MSGSLFAQKPAITEAATGAWEFTVYLDDREIGFHHFYLAATGETRQLQSVASFEYRLMMIPLFRYEHKNNEVWHGNCLQSITSRTDSNGKTFRVDGHRSAGEFRVSATSGEESLPECVMSFAYWNPSFLEQSMLLNTQDGEFLDVAVSEPILEELDVQGDKRPAYRYRLEAVDLELDLWYSPDREWLALESEVQGGRKLRYVLNEGSVGEDVEPGSSLETSLADAGSVSARPGG